MMTAAAAVRRSDRCGLPDDAERPDDIASLACT